MTSLLLGGAKLLLVVQSASAVIHGTVREAGSGRPLPMVVVALPDLGRSAVADSAGRYRIGELADGTHRITARLIGYATHGFGALLSRNASLEIDIALRAEPVELPEIVSRVLPRAGRVPSTADTSLDNLLFTTDRLATHPLLPEPDAAAISGAGVG